MERNGRAISGSRFRKTKSDRMTRMNDADCNVAIRPKASVNEPVSAMAIAANAVATVATEGLPPLFTLWKIVGKRPSRESASNTRGALITPALAQLETLIIANTATPAAAIAPPMRARTVVNGSALWAMPEVCQLIEYVLPAAGMRMPLLTSTNEPIDGSSTNISTPRPVVSTKTVEDP